MDRDRRDSSRKIAENTSISLRPLDPQVWFRFWDGTGCCVRDLSMVGVGVIVEEKMPIGTPLSIDLRLGKNTDFVRIFGKIEWIAEYQQSFRAGVSFSWWKDDQDKAVVNSYLNKLQNAN